MSDEVIRRSIWLRDQLLQCAKEFDYAAQKTQHASAKRMAEHDKATCEGAAEMLAKLGTEVTRLRLVIQHFDAGRMTRFELRSAVENWNGDPAT